MHFLGWIFCGLVAGWLTGKIMKGEGYGFIADILLGVAGAFVGGFIAGHLGFASHGGFFYSLLIATLGAILLVFLARLVTGRR